MEQLMDKLIKAKAIMDMTENTPTTKKSSGRRFESTIENNFDNTNVKYNIPSEYLNDSNIQENYLSTIPNTKPVGVPTVDAIKNSRLPDDIKRLMIEHPISQPQQNQATLSNEIVEKATRLMKNESTTQNNKTVDEKRNIPTGVDYNIIKKMIKEAVDEALKQNGLIVESTEKSSEFFSFKVGKHIFEGKISKIKKLS